MSGADWRVAAAASGECLVACETWECWGRLWLVGTAVAWFCLAWWPFASSSAGLAEACAAAAADAACA